MQPALQDQNVYEAPRKTSPGYLSLKSLHKSYYDLKVVKNLNLELAKGELIALLGPSGCGKTTTLRMIAGLTSITSGRALVGGRDVTDLPVHKRDMGMVFQSYALFPHMTVAKNIAFGLEMRGVARDEIDARVKEALAMVRLSGLGERRPKELSGGQQQRVALARALVIRPSVLLLDEPLSNLDAKLRDKMRQEIREIQQRLGMTTVFVTHDQVEALAMCDKIAVMNNGVIEQLGTPREIYEEPISPFVASFVGRVNDLKGEVVDGRLVVAGNTIAYDQNRWQGIRGKARVMIRPHRIWVMSKNATFDGNLENKASGIVSQVTYVGDLVQYEVDVNGQVFLVEQPTDTAGPPLAVGSHAELGWHSRDTMCFEVAP